MRRLGLCVPFVVLALIGCGSSGGGGTGGSGGGAGSTGKGGAGGAGAKGGAGGGSAGASGNAGATGNAGAGGGSAGASGNAGAGGGSAGAAGSSAGGHAGGGAGGGTAGANGGAGNGGAGGGLAACGSAIQQGEQCSTISGSATGACVAVAASAATAPTPGGGSVANGTYELTSSTFYGTLPDGGGSSDGDFGTRRETFVVKNATASSFTLDQFQAQGGQTASEEGSVTISGSMVTYTQSCPAPGDGGNNGGSAGFTATGTTFTLIMNKSGGTLVRVYTKTS